MPVIVHMHNKTLTLHFLQRFTPAKAHTKNLRLNFCFLRYNIHVQHSTLHLAKCEHTKCFCFWNSNQKQLQIWPLRQSRAHGAPNPAAEACLKPWTRPNSKHTTLDLNTPLCFEFWVRVVSTVVHSTNVELASCAVVQGKSLSSRQIPSLCILKETSVLIHPHAHPCELP